MPIYPPIPNITLYYHKSTPNTVFRGRSLHDVNIMKVDRILTMVNTYRYRVSTMIMNEYIIHVSCHVPAVNCCHKISCQPTSSSSLLAHFPTFIYNYIPDLRKPWPKKILKTMFRGRSLHDVNIMKVDRILTMVK